MNYLDNYYINEIFTGDALFDWVENHTCNLKVPGLFSRGFRAYSKVTGYIPHLLINLVEDKTGDLNSSLRKIKSHQEIKGLSSLLLNGTAKAAALLIRISLVAFTLLSIPVVSSVIVFLLLHSLPLALIAAPSVLGLILIVGYMLSERPSQNGDLYEEIKKGLFTQMHKQGFNLFSDVPLKRDTQEVDPIYELDDTTLFEDIIIASRNIEEVYAAEGFVKDFSNCTINGIVFNDPITAARKILDLLDGDEKQFHEISQFFNRNISSALRNSVIQARGVNLSFEMSDFSPSMSLTITPDKTIFLTVIAEKEMEGMHYHASAIYDFNERTITTRIKLDTTILVSNHNNT